MPTNLPKRREPSDKEGELSRLLRHPAVMIVGAVIISTFINEQIDKVRDSIGSAEVALVNSANADQNAHGKSPKPLPQEQRSLDGPSISALKDWAKPAPTLEGTFEHPTLPRAVVSLAASLDPLDMEKADLARRVHACILRGKESPDFAVTEAREFGAKPDEIADSVRAVSIVLGDRVYFVLAGSSEVQELNSTAVSFSPTDSGPRSESVLLIDEGPNGQLDTGNDGVNRYDRHEHLAGSSAYQAELDRAYAEIISLPACEPYRK
ncbi:hypothetical protein HY605_05795 [Candidatus Peregrinibacteria bacterium]|nr:hypothetical protein [Candidatus Peregrinibacteria bacterium]